MFSLEAYIINLNLKTSLPNIYCNWMMELCGAGSDSLVLSQFSDTQLLLSII